MFATTLRCVAGMVAILTVGGPWAAGQRPTDRPAATATQRHRSLNNLKQILIAIHNYHDAYGYLPSDLRDKDGKPLLSWRVAILPYVEEDRLYSQFKLDQPWDSEHNKKLLARVPAVYRVGVEAAGSTDTYYQAFAGPDTPFHPQPGRGAGRAARGFRLPDLTDGTSNTLGVIEAGPAVPWTKPADLPFDPKKPSALTGPFRDVVHVSMMDGSTWPLKADLDRDVVRRLIGIRDGEVTPPLESLRATTPAETAEEKERLKKQLAENQQTIDEIARLMKEHTDLLAANNKKIADLVRAEEQGKRLRRFAAQIAEANQRERGERSPNLTAPPPRPPAESRPPGR
jgi:hypothetical protein